jgi:hypothetical protein
MRRQEHQSGFSTTVVLLLILAVTALATTGFVVYQHHRSNSAKTSAATSQTQTTAQPSSAATTQPAATTTKYLTIKEWGVRLPLSDTIKTAYYNTAKGSSNGKGGVPSSVWLGLASLSSSSCNPGNNDAGGRGAIGAMLRVLPTDTDPVSGKLLTQEYPNGATVGGYYYTYQSWLKNSPCASQSTLQPIDASFATAAKNTVSATEN